MTQNPSKTSDFLACERLGSNSNFYTAIRERENFRSAFNRIINEMDSEKVDLLKQFPAYFDGFVHLYELGILDSLPQYLSPVLLLQGAACEASALNKVVQEELLTLLEGSQNPLNFLSAVDDFERVKIENESISLKDYILSQEEATQEEVSF